MPGRSRTLLAFLLLGVVTGCATSASDVSTSDIPELRARLVEAPGDSDARLQLGIALYKAERMEEAEDVLSELADVAERRALADLYLGLSHEAQAEWQDAVSRYRRFLDSDPPDDLATRVRGRLALATRRLFQAQAAELVAREDQLADAAPTPRSVGVLPFEIVASDPQYEPLERALAGLMATDLAMVGSVRVLERARIRALLDELELTEEGVVDPMTGARAGRLLRAEHLVQGLLAVDSVGRMRLDADVLRSTTGESAARIGHEESLEDFFRLEKAAVFSVLDALNVSPTVAEREAIEQNRTANLMALMAYGRGLRALDRGRFSEARAAFQEAAQMARRALPAS